MDSNLYKWINKALFLDALRLLFSTEIPEFFAFAFEGKSKDFYRTVIKHSAKYMSLLNSFIENKSQHYREELPLYRGMSISACKDFDQDMVYRFINFQSCSSNLNVVFKNFLPKEALHKTLYLIRKPKLCPAVAQI